MGQQVERQHKPLVIDALSAPELAALVAIVTARRAYSFARVLQLGGHEPETLVGLVEAEWLDYWDHPEGLALTLTPLAAATLEYWIHERLTTEGGLLEEVPYWDQGKPARPIRLPRVRGEVRFSDMGPAQAAAVEPSYLMDEYSDEPVTLFGRPVPIDRRLRRKRA